MTHNFIPIALGISFAFEELTALASWALAGVGISIGALTLGTAGVTINEAQAVQDLEKCLKDSLNRPDKKDHILQDKHNWHELVPDPNNNWDKIVEIIKTVMATGACRPEGKKNLDIFIKAAKIGNRMVEVKYRVEGGIERISAAWVK